MKVTLVEYTGSGHPDPARHAANLLVFTKNTRLTMSPGLFDEIAQRPWSDIEKELAYMANTIPSSWEFCDYTFMIEGVTRAFTHQFVRTRTGSYAQQTMRVLDVEGWETTKGPTILADESLDIAWDVLMGEIDDYYRRAIRDGAKIEDARGVLPTNIHTNIVAKFNLRSVAELVRKRSSSRTQGEYRDVLDAMKAEVMRVHPWSKMFLDRDFERAAADLDTAIRALPISQQEKMDMIKFIDQMRIM